MAAERPFQTRTVGHGSGRPAAPIHGRSVSESGAEVPPWPEIQIPMLSRPTSPSGLSPRHHAWPSGASVSSTNSGAATAPGDWPTVVKRPDSAGSAAELGMATSGAPATRPEQRDADRSAPAVPSAPQAQRREFDGTWTGSNGWFKFFGHWLTLLVAERPMTAHRQWLGLSQKPASPKEGDVAPEKRPRASIKRRLLLGMGSSHRRFIPLESLEEQYAGNRKRRRLMYALRRHHTPGSYRGRFDALTNEAFIFFQLVFDRCTPRRMRSHPPWFTCCYLALTFVTFAFMAGEYPAFIQQQQARDIDQVCTDYSYGTGPDGLAAWVYRWNGCYRFEPSFLVLWGATYAPKIKDANQWWRWLSSILLADSFPHVAANAFLFAVIGLHVESRFTTRVTAFLVLIAGVGGNFFDASFRGVCPVIISAAGCTFGLLTLFSADFLLNFETIRYPIPRLVVTGIALVLFILGATILGYPYRLTPLGGFLTALLPSLLFLPHAGSEVLEWMIAPLALVTCIGFLVALPLYIYLVRFPHAQCGSLVL